MAPCLRRKLAFSIVAAIGAATVASAATSRTPARFPYVAYVSDPDTYVRSGPSSHHYPTGQLPAGYAVEVYRHDADGWCAIRPPDGSFSLVPVHQIRAIDQHTAEIASDGVVARVGSGLGSQRNAVQVLLQRGEVVHLLEPVAPGAAWVRIAPPAGEFRWIADRRLSHLPPLEAEPAHFDSSSGWQAQTFGKPLVKQPAPSAFDSSGGAPVSRAPASTSPLFQAANNVAPAQRLPVAGSAEQLDVVENSPAAVRLAAYEQETAAPPGPTTDAAPAPAEPPALIADQAPTTTPPRIKFEGISPPAEAAAAPGEAATSSRVSELQFKLSKAVVARPTEWNLAPLREEAAAALAQESSPAGREGLRDLLERIATFEMIQARYATVAAAPVPAPAYTMVAAPSPLGPPTAIPAAPNQPAANPGGLPGAIRSMAAMLTAPPTAAAPMAAAPPAPNAAPMTNVASLTPMPAAAPSRPVAPAGPTGDSAEVLARVRADLGRGPAQAPVPAATQFADTGPTEALYDAVGTLKPVVSRRENAPQFALVDDHGDVVTFVTSTADVNLQTYVGKRIGVKGSRGFMPEYRRAHVVASRITPLEEKLVR